VELTIPVGARGTALAGAGVANVNGLDAIFWNPPWLGNSSTTSEALFSHTNYIADIGVDYFAAGANLQGIGSIAFSLKSLSFGDIPVTTEISPEGTGETYSPRYTTMGLTYSRALTDRVSAGVTVKLVLRPSSEPRRPALHSMPASNILLGLSRVARASLWHSFEKPRTDHAVRRHRSGTDSHSAGCISQRDGPRHEIYVAGVELPSTLEMALSYDIHLGDVNRVTLMTLFRNNNYSEDEYAGALEYCYDETISLRGGYIASPDADSGFVHLRIDDGWQESLWILAE